MNTKQIWIAIAVIVIIILAGWWAYASMQEEEAMMGQEDGAMMNDGDAMMEGDEGDAMMDDGEAMDDGAMMDDDGGDATVREGSYEEYAPEKLAMAANGDVVLFFRADWCPTCRALDADIRSNLSGIPDGITILSVDYDTATELRQKYGVTYQHTLVQVDAEGNMIAKWTGSPTLAALLTQVN